MAHGKALELRARKRDGARLIWPRSKGILVYPDRRVWRQAALDVQRVNRKLLAEASRRLEEAGDD